MGLLKQVIGSAVATRAFGARSSVPLLVAAFWLGVPHR